MGSGAAQVCDLEAAVDAVSCDIILVISPIEQTRLTNIDTPYQKTGYRPDEEGEGLIEAVHAAVA